MPYTRMDSTNHTNQLCLRDPIAINYDKNIKHTLLYDEFLHWNVQSPSNLCDREPQLPRNARQHLFPEPCQKL